MGLIKSTHAPPTMSTFSMRDVEAHAKSILIRAQQQADALLASAQGEAASMRDTACHEGFVAGHEAGTAEGLAQGTKQGLEQGAAAALAEHRAALTAALNALTTAMAEIDASQRAMETEALRDVIELATAIARRVTKRQAMLDPEVLLANLNEAMKLVVQASDLRVAINPAQRATLDAAIPQLGIEWPSLAHATIVDDPSLSPGGVRVFTRQGRVEADIDGQLERVINELLPEPKPDAATGAA
ncbi:MAG TPA: FliH/SctL family protein [Tepidisphaeraceae bacterium]|jgi:flagellar assembly protein FliH|nr:FliH/SctL family protein [Tepidisphaeraceae bacterium]